MFGRIACPHWALRWSMMSQQIPETRWAILELLQKRGELSVGEMADRLELHPMSIRQHLMALEGEHYVTFRRVRIPRGRPTHVYRLTEKGLKLFPDNYEGFALRLLEGVRRLDGEEKLVQLLQMQMESLLEDYREKLIGYELDEQIEILADLLNQSG